MCEEPLALVFPVDPSAMGTFIPLQKMYRMLIRYYFDNKRKQKKISTLILEELCPSLAYGSSIRTDTVGPH